MPEISKKIYEYIKGEIEASYETIEEEIYTALIWGDEKIGDIVVDIAASATYAFSLYHHLKDESLTKDQGITEARILAVLSVLAKNICGSNQTLAILDFGGFIKEAKEIVASEPPSSLDGYGIDDVNRYASHIADMVYRHPGDKASSSRPSESFSWRDIPALKEKASTIHPFHRYLLDSYSICFRESESFFFVFDTKEAFNGFDWGEILKVENTHFIFDSSLKKSLMSKVIEYKSAASSTNSSPSACSNPDSAPRKTTYIERSQQTDETKAKRMILSYFPNAVFTRIPPEAYREKEDKSF